MIVGMMLLGSSVYAAVLNSRMAKRLFQIGIMTLFVGGYTVLDVMMVSFTDELLVMRTYGGQLCLMLGIYFGGIIVCDAIKGKYKKVAEAVIGISGIINMLMIAVVISGKVLLYDTRIVWECSQCIVSLMLILFCLLEIKEEKEKRTELLTYVLIHTAVLLDFTGVGYHMFYSGICFKVSSVIMLLIILIRGAKQVVMDHQASIKNQKIKAELENSRITVMLSQIQPLVENAVKHGVGFTEGEYADDGSTHVGLENIRKRLNMMINAELQMESKIGEGTKACIVIPKRRD